ncbi:glycosyltransferase family 2 protein [Hyphobacterium sp. CCMP332]|nr:glycosyltransferase family 2 protein [Hyphobacterium sp. CCMP332]
MKAEAIIATRNRPESCRRLADQLLEIGIFRNIIIVDSSDSEHSGIFKEDQIIHIKCPVQNQPFQRYTGYKRAMGDVLFFFDDDVRITNTKGIHELFSLFSTADLAGASLGIELDRDNPEKMSGEIRHNVLLSGIKKFKAGEYWIYGLKQAYPINGGMVHYLKGPAFATRKEFLYRNFDFRLFDIYERGLGKGEDAILSYTLSKQGPIQYLPIDAIHHQVVDQSAYAQSAISFYKRYAFSRYFHTLNYCRLNKVSFIKKVGYLLVYYALIFSTLIKSMLGSILKWSKNDLERTKGISIGILKSTYLLNTLPSRQTAFKKWNTKADQILETENINSLN